MSITLSKEWQIGWRRHNPDDLCLVVNFINQKTGKRLFVYAPKHEDKEFFLNLFAELEEHEKVKKGQKCAIPEE